MIALETIIVAALCLLSLLLGGAILTVETKWRRSPTERMLRQRRFGI